jgi:hypothetical protein
VAAEVVIAAGSAALVTGTAAAAADDGHNELMIRFVAKRSRNEWLVAGLRRPSASADWNCPRPAGQAKN